MHLPIGEIPVLLIGDALAWDPERELLRAVLERAIFDIIGRCTGAALTEPGKRRLIQVEAKQWMGLERGPGWKDENEPFSFLWICYHLSLCPKQIRKKVLFLQRNLLH